MKTIIVAALLSLVTGSAMADSCTATSASKHLAGAAQTSFMKKCAKDAQTACDAQAAEKKIYGAAKTSFTTKCVKDAVGAASNPS